MNIWHGWLTSGLSARRPTAARVHLWLGGLLLAVTGTAAAGTFQIALPASLSGSGEFGAKPTANAIRMAVDESNAEGNGQTIELKILDDQSKVDTARRLAQDIGKSEALVTLGPVSSHLALSSLDLYRQAGVPAILSTTHADDVTKYKNAFRTVISISELGDAISNYLFYAPGGRRFAGGVEAAAQNVDMGVEIIRFRGEKDRAEAIAATAAAAAALRPGERPGHKETSIILGMTYEEGVHVMLGLKRLGARGPFLAPAAFARAGFASLFKNEPEEKKKPGYFTEGLYVAAPVLMDSTNTRTLEFAQRYEKRYGTPASW